MGIILGIAVVDPDPQRRRGPGHPDPEIRGWGGGGAPQSFHSNSLHSVLLR